MATHDYDTSLSSANSFQYLTFYCGRELFGLAVGAVKQIIEPDAMTRIPGAARHIRGVIEVDDDVIPIVDLPMKIGAVSEGEARRSCVVLARVPMEHRESIIGLWVTEVREIVEVAVDDIRTAPSVNEGADQTDCVGALAHTDDGLIVLIDAGEILSADEFLNASRLKHDLAQGVNANTSNVATD
ncbi:hypothetical protein CHH28_11860 [Bacterioplanes sanyensis]|uniref:CheW-like domain-containing protein n=1 Tax=Bacterioplanes sanyensis TaxID=1249553 RepID=A0A222FKQ0_9GAMM|nr:chemotaxis protein CheW [Bacterioplanes sanyensis]ASP39329.1 hypothetical protein CHH28_11860 [Bacterioplanes sanyensis]